MRSGTSSGTERSRAAPARSARRTAPSRTRTAATPSAATARRPQRDRARIVPQLGQHPPCRGNCHRDSHAATSASAISRKNARSIDAARRCGASAPRACRAPSNRPSRMSSRRVAAIGLIHDVTRDEQGRPSSASSRNKAQRSSRKYRVQPDRGFVEHEQPGVPSMATARLTRERWPPDSLPVSLPRSVYSDLRPRSLAPHHTPGPLNTAAKYRRFSTTLRSS